MVLLDRLRMLGLMSVQNFDKKSIFTINEIYSRPNIFNGIGYRLQYIYDPL